MLPLTLPLGVALRLGPISHLGVTSATATSISATRVHRNQTKLTLVMIM